MKLLKYINLLLLGLYIVSGSHANADKMNIIPAGEFSRGRLDEWVPKKFVNETLYSLVKVDGKTVLKAVSQKSASGLIKKIKIDIEKYPFLNWSWRVEKQLINTTDLFTIDEKQKSGDDYAARIYVVVSGRIAFWNTITVNYVWAHNSEKGETWPNAFAPKNAVMMALRSSKAPLSVWNQEKRNVREDFKKLFGKEIKYIDAVVIMSDTDNTQKEVLTYYGDIYFSKQ